MNQMTVRVTPDGDGVWRIHFELEAESFSGRGWCWGNPESLVEFASQLTPYPLPEGATLRLGYNHMIDDDAMLSLTIRPVGSLGVLEARVEIADADDPTCRLKAKLNTSYASIDRFVPQLRALASETREQAVLLGG
jgi:hypothetical protein